MAKAAPQVGIVSLGCPKALVDSERILTKLHADGYTISGTYDGADVVIVNTCGFLDSAKIERLEAIGEALDENGRVIVTGCLGADENAIRDVHPDRFSVSRPHQYETVIVAVHEAAPPVAKAERPMDACVQELLLVSQDTGAYGTDLKYAKSSNKHWATPARITELCRVIGSFGAWVQLH